MSRAVLESLSAKRMIGGTLRMLGGSTTRTVRVGDIASSWLEKHARVRGVGVAALTRAAVGYYLDDRDSGRPGWLLPRFGRSRRDGRRAGELQVTLSDAEWSGLEREALLRRADVDAMLGHAVLYYLADLEGGRTSHQV